MPTPGRQQAKYWSDSKRPEHWVVSRAADEGRRESGTRDIANMKVEDLAHYNKEVEDRDPSVKSGAHPSPFEVSGDSLARLKAGKPAKEGWDVRRD